MPTTPLPALPNDTPSLRLLTWLLEQCNQQQTQLANTLPNWLTERQAFACKHLQALGLPSNKLEAWKYIDLRRLLSPLYQACNPSLSPQANKAISAVIAQHPFSQQGPYITLVNGQMVPTVSQLSQLPTGLTVCGFQQAFPMPLARGAASDVLRVHVGQGVLDSESDAHQDAFAALNLAMATDGFLIHAAEGVTSSQPITVFVVSTPDTQQAQLATVRGLVHAEMGGHVSVRVIFLSVATVASQASATPNSSDYQPFLNNVALDVYAHEHAHIELSYLLAGKRLGNTAPAVSKLVHTQAQLQHHAKVDISSVVLSGLLSRLAVGVNYLGEYAEATLNGLSVLNNQQQVHHHTQVQHRLPNCTTDQLYKGIVSGEAKLEFDGTITVFPDAQHTQANQVNRNLLLSDTARVWTRPQLRIDANDVKCTHGATVGQLNPDELFYCQTRGLDLGQAKSMLTLGFAKEVLNRLSGKQCPIQLTEALTQALQQQGR
jgi:Fe-S cluster assembly protein SufD